MKKWWQQGKEYWWVYLMLPMALMVNPWGFDAFENDKVTIFLVASCIALVKVVEKRKVISEYFVRATLQTPALYYAMYMGWATLATLFSVAPIRSLMGSLLRRQGLITIALGFVWYLYVRMQKKDNETLVRILGIVSSVIVAITCVLALWQLQVGTFIYSNIPLIDTDKPLYLLRPSATYGHPLYFAIATMMLLPFIYAYTKTLAKKWKYSVLVVMGLLVAPALYVTRSRVIFVMIAAWVGAYLYLHWNKKIAYTVAGICVVVGGVLLSSTNLQQVYLRLPSVVVRLHEWKFGAGYIVRSPFFGYGFETYDTFSVARERQEGEPNDGIADRLHMIVLDVAWETGIPSAIFYGMVWYLLLLKRKKRSGVQEAAYYASAQYIIAMLTLFHFSFTFYMVPTLLALLDDPIEGEGEKSSVMVKIFSGTLMILAIAPSLSLVFLNSCIQKMELPFMAQASCKTARMITPFYGELYLFERDTLRDDETTLPERIRLMEWARRVGTPPYKNLSPE